MATYEDDLIARARDLQRLLTKRRRLKRQLKVIEGDLKIVKKALKAVQMASANRQFNAIPSRLTNGATGFIPLAETELVGK
jgi:hypothetical protein